LRAQRLVRLPWGINVTTPIIMLVLMMAPYLVVRILSAITRRDFDVRGAAAIGLGILFVFTGSGHFIQTEPMAQMLPPWVPQRTLLVYLTGGLEFAIAVGFFVRRLRRLSGWVGAAILVLFFPANLYAAINHIPFGGHAWGPVYLLIRAPLQVIILWWVYWFTIKRPNRALDTDAQQRRDAPPLRAG
jgi:uncharacterized membrane protein